MKWTYVLNLSDICLVVGESCELFVIRWIAGLDLTPYLVFKDGDGYRPG
jgi:hypothetical protein